MLLRAEITSKTIGNKTLFRGLDIKIDDGEKIGLIGRNGVGKTTLFGVLAGTDASYEGEVVKRRGLSIATTAQEHIGIADKSCVEYILDSLPEYLELERVIVHHPETMGQDMARIGEYTHALDRFHDLGYYDIEAKVLQSLGAYQITEAMARAPLARLSGGQKRFVELVKVTQAAADLALIDEPTNHMDYVAKAAFVNWLKDARAAVVVITHDRDVLKAVDRIVEIKDLGAVSFKGNYDSYLAQNSSQTVSDINQYEVAQRTIDNLKKQIAYARSKKAGWSGTADKKNPFVVMETRLTKQLNDLQATIGRPSFWIDQESVEQLDDRVVDSYDRYKAKNIRLSGLDSTANYSWLVKASDVSLGYDAPLFDKLTFQLASGDHINLKGRNGAGKTTLIGFIRSQIGDGTKSQAKQYSGKVVCEPRLKLGVYEQEISAEYLDMPLGEAVMQVFRQHDLALNQQQVRRTLADYLFDPTADYNLAVSKLSGGQKARFQLIAMLCHKPDLLILDEPTNHLDLPSIEELERALAGFRGAILYVSHDSYFQESVGGQVVQIGPS